MIVVLKSGAPEKKILELEAYIKGFGVNIHRIDGVEYSVLGLVGDTHLINKHNIITRDIVQKVERIQEPYKKANIKFHPDPTIIDVNGRQIGGNKLAMIAGPCSVESEEQIVEIAKSVKASGAQFLRGGAFKPRTSPYSFQGLGHEGLDLLNIAKKETGLPIVSEIMAISQVDLFEQMVDVVQVGTRNMQNFSLLKELGKINKPILLKRGMSATIDELLMSAEYIMAEGNDNVILCERGIRTFETSTRNTMDISAIPVLKSKTHLPIIVDPSHATGTWKLVEPMTMAAIAAGADGVIVEVHNKPEEALCDGDQCIKPSRFDSLMQSINKLVPIVNKSL
jgi:3-deoxy-7-phosphoheptulonate synthase